MPLCERELQIAVHKTLADTHRFFTTFQSMQPTQACLAHWLSSETLFFYLMLSVNVVPSRPPVLAVVVAAAATSASPELLPMLPLKEVIHHCVVLGAARNPYGSRNRAGVRPCCKGLVCSWLLLSLGPCSRCQNNRHVGISCVLTVLFQVGAEGVLPEHCFSLQNTRNAHSTNT